MANKETKVLQTDENSHVKKQSSKENDQKAIKEWTEWERKRSASRATR